MSGKKKSFAPAETEQSSAVKSDTTSTSNNNTTTATKPSTNTTEYDDKKGRHFWYVVYPTEEWIRAHDPQCEYDGSAGWGTAPDDWIELLRQTGLAFCVSPLHDKDTNPDGAIKKPHWHLIVSWGNSTTYRSARALCEMLQCPLPRILKNPTGAYRYHQHKDNPEKHQYEEQSKAYNGWERPLDSGEVTQIKQEIRHIIYLEDCIEYDELLEVLEDYGPEYEDVGVNNSFFCVKLLSGYREHPVRGLLRYWYKLADDAPEKEVIRQRLKQYGYDMDEARQDSDGEVNGHYGKEEDSGGASGRSEARGEEGEGSAGNG